MSCRVLGREVEEACLNVLAAGARAMGAERIVAEYRPTAKNGMVRGLYEKLGFTLESSDPDGNTRWSLELRDWTPKPVVMRVVEQAAADGLATDQETKDGAGTGDGRGRDLEAAYGDIPGHLR
jgi:hypothetical protein